MAMLDGATIAAPAHVGRFEPALAEPVDTTQAATVTNDVMPGVVTRSHGGASSRGYGAQWFGRLHAVPSQQKFGEVRKATDADIELYNAGDAGETVSAVTATGDDGLTLDGVSLPAAVPARESVVFTLSVVLDGPTVIDASYLFDAGDTDVNALLLVTGERLLLRVWTVPPDWSQPVLERWQWRTDVQRAHDGSEHRNAIYPHPRRGLEFRLVETDIPAVDRLLSGWQTGLFVVPRWMDVRRLTAPATAGAATLSVDTTVGEWRVGGEAVLIDGRVSDVATVDAVADDQLTLTTALQNDWPAGAAVYPARLMRLPLEVELSRVTAGVATGRVQFLADADTQTPYTADDGATTFDGVPVYLEEPNRRSPAAASYRRHAQRIDSNVGLVLVDDPDGDPAFRHDWQFLFGTRAAADGFVRWLLARAGRAAAFYAPTWSSDLQVTQTIQAGDTTVTVAPIDWARWYEGRANRSVVAVQARDGRWLFARVTAASLLGGDEVLTLDRELVPTGDDPVATADVRRAGWLEKSRLDADRVELAWHSVSVLEAAIPVAGVE